MNRPLVWLTIALAAGIGLEHWLALGEKTCFIVAILLLTGCVGLLLQRRPVTAPLLALVFVCGGLWLATVEAGMHSTLAAFAGSQIELQGVVLTQPEGDGETMVWELGVAECRLGRRAFVVHPREKVRVYYFPGGDGRGLPDYGDLIQVEGELAFPRSGSNPGEFDFREYLRHHRVFTCLYANGQQNLKILGPGKGNAVVAAACRAKSRFREFLERERYHRQAPLLMAVLFGQDTGLSDKEEQIFRETGIAHILAVSGLHTGFVLLLLLGAARIARLGKKQTLVLSVFGLVCYCALANFAVSVVRATIMAVLGLLAFFLDREKNVFLGLSAAALAILLWNPNALFEVGFQLSFVSVWSIAYLVPVFDDCLSSLPRWKTVLTVPLAAQLGTAPIILYHFNIFPAVSLLANCLLVPLLGVVVIAGFSSFVFSFLSTALASLPGQTAQGLLALMMKTAQCLDSLPGAAWYFAAPPLALIGVYYFLLILLREKLSGNRRVFEGWSRFSGGRTFRLVAGTAAALAVGAVLFVACTPQSLKVVFLDVGQGDAIFVRSPGGTTVLIDGGGKAESAPGNFEPGKDTVVPFLRREGVRKLDLLINTHPDADHINGLIAVVEEIHVGTILTPPVSSMQEDYASFLTTVEREGIPRREVSRGSRILLEHGIVLDVLAPGAGAKADSPNNYSLVIELSHGRNRFLLTGDLEAEGCGRLAEQTPDLDCTILKIPHHGSIDAFNLEFNEKAKPETVVISVGQENPFGHPSAQVVDYWRRRGVPLYRTDINGAVTVRSDGYKCTVSTVR